MSERGPERIYYDGDCAVCQASVRFVAARETCGRFRFAPLHGDTFRAEIAPDVAASLPDAMVVRRHDGRLLVRSDAVVHILRQLPSPWPVVAGMVAAVPRPLRDLAYDVFARLRHRVVRRGRTCPLPSAELARRLDP